MVRSNYTYCLLYIWIYPYWPRLPRSKVSGYWVYWACTTCSCTTLHSVSFFSFVTASWILISHFSLSYFFPSNLKVIIHFFGIFQRFIDYKCNFRQLYFSTFLAGLRSWCSCCVIFNSVASGFFRSLIIFSTLSVAVLAS